MDELLKGNFKVKRPVHVSETENNHKESLEEQVKKKVLGSLGGSMVYVERNQLNWEGDE